MATGLSDILPLASDRGATRDRAPQPTREGLFRAVAGDAAALARAVCGDASWRSLARTVLANDGFAILVLWRVRLAVRRWHVPVINSLLRRIQTAVYGIEIGNDVALGRGVYFIHPIGVVVGGTAQIGERVRFLGSNTVGTASDNGWPIIGDDAVIGAGARILGPVSVGARAVIGANAVVVKSVPPDCVAVGIPATWQRSRGESSRS